MDEETHHKITWPLRQIHHAISRMDAETHHKITWPLRQIHHAISRMDEETLQDYLATQPDSSCNIKNG
ncbi:hypothetical protein ACJMK2_001265 [Sinanodonta woodiana]|uniref:Uncharacterized protein n=1 Tax=Sinanodonta woodiana TaxID=1069815 RepID=A0ABD3XRT7_SINWO